IFHYESKGDKDKIINEVKIRNKKVGIAINPDTNSDLALPFLNNIDLVLIMSVHPGLSGQKLISEMVERVNLLSAYRIENNLEFLIDIDGGINIENSILINSDILTSASTILNAKDPKHVIKTLKYSDKA
ncbi:MAG: ribulose-phosphate 3-epimerase, partial [Candidatus Hodarchaeales archaeon]